mgnify:FL=1
MKEILEYKKIAKVNQSSLKKILHSPGAYRAAVNKYEESTESHFVFGSLVDDMLLAPKTVDDKYYKMADSDISTTLKLIAQHVYEAAKLNPIDDSGKVLCPLHDIYYQDLILNAKRTYAYQPRWKDETAITNIVKSCSNYFNALIESNGKVIISIEEYNKALTCVAMLKSDKYTSKYLVKPSQNISIFTHVVLEFETEGVKCKAELDKVFIDHVNKTIQPIDYKTTGMPINGFKYEFWKYRYDFQAAFYKLGLSQDSKIIKLLEDGYELLNFRYIVVNSDGNDNPMIFVVPKEVNAIGLHGGKLDNGRTLEGVHQAIGRYQYHTVNDAWDYPREYYQREGSLIIEL